MINTSIISRFFKRGGLLLVISFLMTVSGMGQTLSGRIVDSKGEAVP